MYVKVSYRVWNKTLDFYQSGFLYLKYNFYIKTVTNNVSLSKVTPWDM